MSTFYQLLAPILEKIFFKKYQIKLDKEKFKFEKLHTEKFLFFKDIYSQLCEIETELPKFDVKDTSRIERLRQRFYKLKSDIDKNAFLVPDHVELALRTFVEKGIEIWAYQTQATIQHSIQDFPEAKKSALSAYRSIQEELPILKNDLKNIIRAELRG